MDTVLSVGQCNPDHSRISAVFEQHFGARVETADSQAEAIRLAEANRYAIILVNRVLDATGSSGLDIIGVLAASESSKSPLMLVSNYEDAQTEAIALGAVPGFGKAKLDENSTLEIFRQYLSDNQHPAV